VIHYLFIFFFAFELNHRIVVNRYRLSFFYFGLPAPSPPSFPLLFFFPLYGVGFRFEIQYIQCYLFIDL
jgi:hypothetical protein